MPSYQATAIKVGDSKTEMLASHEFEARDTSAARAAADEWSRSGIVTSSGSTSSSASSARDDEALHQYMVKIFQMNGFLLRASTVCDEKSREFADVSLRLQTFDGDLQTVAKAFPDMTTRWVMHGASMMNDIVMKEGVSLPALRHLYSC